jgi:hypothetical protein
MSEFVGDSRKSDSISLSSSSTSGTGIQRKLMNAKLLDSEVQQEIFPDIAHVDISTNVALSGSSLVDEVMSARVRVQAAAVDDINSALGDLLQWRNALRESSSSSKDSNLTEGGENEKYAKLIAFVDDELKVSLTSESDGKGLHYESHARLKALSQRRNVHEDKAETNFANIISSNAELAHMRSSCLGKDYLGLQNLEATKNQLLAELEIDENAMAKLEKQLNERLDIDIDIDEMH